MHRKTSSTLLMKRYKCDTNTLNLVTYDHQSSLITRHCSERTGPRLRDSMASSHSFLLSSSSLITAFCSLLSLYVSTFIFLGVLLAGELFSSTANEGITDKTGLIFIVWDLSYLMNTVFLSSLTPHLYAQDMGLYNVRFYTGFTILMLDLLKYTPLSAMHVIGASNHQQISFTCCGNALNYLSIGLK